MLPVMKLKSIVSPALVFLVLCTVDYIKHTHAEDSKGTDIPRSASGVHLSSFADLFHQSSYKTQALHGTGFIASTATLDISDLISPTSTQHHDTLMTTVTSSGSLDGPFDTVSQTQVSTILGQTSSDISVSHTVSTEDVGKTPASNIVATLPLSQSEVITSSVFSQVSREPSLWLSGSSDIALATQDLSSAYSIVATVPFSQSEVITSSVFSPVSREPNIVSSAYNYTGSPTSDLLSTKSKEATSPTSQNEVETSSAFNQMSSEPHLLPSGYVDISKATSGLPSEILTSTHLQMSTHILSSVILPGGNQSDLSSSFITTESLPFSGDISYISTSVWTSEFVSSNSSHSNQTTIDLPSDVSLSGSMLSDLARIISTPVSYKSDSEFANMSTILLPIDYLSAISHFSDITSNVISDLLSMNSSFSLYSSTILIQDLSLSINQTTILSTTAINSSSGIFDYSSISDHSGFEITAPITGSLEPSTLSGYMLESTLPISLTFNGKFTESYFSTSATPDISSNSIHNTDIFVTTDKFTTEGTKITSAIMTSASVTTSPSITITAQMTTSVSEIVTTSSAIVGTTTRTTISSSTAQAVTEKSSSARGLSEGGKIAIGIIVPLAIIGLVMLGVIFYRRYTSSHRSLKDFLQSSVRYRTYTNDTYTDDEGALIIPS